jgi:hypothetical protein
MTANVPKKSTIFKASRHGQRGEISASQRQVSLPAEQNTDINTFGIEWSPIALYIGMK